MTRTLIIAEAGVNHNGSLELAKKMVDEAIRANVDIIKFQTFRAENLVTKDAMKAEYQKKNLCGDDTQFKMLKDLELSKDDFFELKEYCDSLGIEFLSTAFDLDSIDFLNELGVVRFKIPSGEITNLPYLIKIANTRKPVILSTGMSSMDEICDAVKILEENGTPEITILHCTTEYPTPYNDVNLNAMISIKNKFNSHVGYSDHTEGIEVAIAAVALGASVIEKHFTLDKNMEGPDHKASLLPEELYEMVDAIRHIELALGNGYKYPTESEKSNMEVIRKSIVAKCNIKIGEILNENNLTVKRPGIGINPMMWNDLIGTRAKRDFNEDELIEL